MVHSSVSHSSIPTTLLSAYETENCLFPANNGTISGFSIKINLSYVNGKDQPTNIITHRKVISI